MHNLCLDLEENELNIMNIWKITLQCQICDQKMTLKGKKKNDTLSTEKGFCSNCRLHGDWIIEKVIYSHYKFLKTPMGTQFGTSQAMNIQ